MPALERVRSGVPGGLRPPAEVLRLGHSRAAEREFWVVQELRRPLLSVTRRESCVQITLQGLEEPVQSSHLACLCFAFHSARRVFNNSFGLSLSAGSSFPCSSPGTSSIRMRPKPHVGEGPFRVSLPCLPLLTV